MSEALTLTPKPLSLMKRLWGLKEVQGIDVDGPEHFSVHREVLMSKPLLRQTYQNWYRQFLTAYRDTTGISGDIVEIGCGTGFLEQLIPDLVKTDSQPNPYAREVVDAQNMGFESSSLRAIFMVGVLHHLPEPEKFLREAERCLKPGGRLVMIEPTINFPQKVLCKVLDHYEFFDQSIQDWKNAQAHNMTGANLALPWVIFFRDKDLFQKKFPNLKMRPTRYHSLLLLLLSGGMSYRQFVPSFTLPLWRMVEFALSPLMGILGTSMTIDLEKTV